MPEKRYRKKPELWWGLQYIGTNVAEMQEFCSWLTYDEAEEKLIYANMIEVAPTSWILKDNAGEFSVMVESQFQAYFEETPGGNPLTSLNYE
jgi:hypothetical protein